MISKASYDRYLLIFSTRTLVAMFSQLELT
jgi:hypothetical protein